MPDPQAFPERPVLKTHRAGLRWCRITQALADYSAESFNPHTHEAAASAHYGGRYDPFICHRRREPVSTLYLGHHWTCALSEVLFRYLVADRPNELRTISTLEVNQYVGNELTNNDPMVLLDLTVPAVECFGEQCLLLDRVDARQYATTRAWAQAWYQAYPQAQGLQWASRQSGELAVMLFGDRCADDCLHAKRSNIPIIGNMDDELDDLLERNQVVLVP